MTNADIECLTLLRALDDAQARIKQLEEALALGQIVMDLLDKYGAPIVPHLIDTDENVGERFRRALARTLMSDMQYKS